MQTKRLFLSLRAKFVILFCLLITIPFFVSGLITYRQYSRNVEDDSTAYTRQIIDQVSINLDRYIKDMDRLTMAPYYDNNVLGILRAHESPPPAGASGSGTYVSSEEAGKMNLMISSLAIDRSELQSILIFAYDGNLFSNLENSVSKHWEPDANPWMKEVEAADGDLVVIPPHAASYYLDEPRQVVSIARVIRETFTNRHLGIVKVDLTEQGFEKILASARFSRNSRIYVSDRQGRLLYPVSSDIRLSAVGPTMTYQGETFLTAAERSDYTGMQVVGLIPQDEVKRGARDLSRFTLYISLASILLAYFAAGVASGKLVKPIRHLQVKMKRVQKGDFGERAKVTTYDEIGQLTEGFNVMVTEIERLVKEVYEGKLREREAELDALQRQINPHFIYNTLESINSLALDSHQHELSDVVVNLGRLLRYTVERKERFVYLRDEISFVEAYLQIHNSRLGRQLRTELHVELGHDYLMMPKLILQPLLENVIEHALGSAPVTVRLYTRIEAEHLLIYVQDDGAGMSEERRVQVERHMYAAGEQLSDRRRFGEKRKGFALRNVHWRLHLLYGEGCGLFIDRSAAAGTVFYLRLPLLYEEEASS